MPWTIKDVDKHKKGLSASEKRKWVKIANNALKYYKDEGKAIKVANSRTKHSTNESFSNFFKICNLVKSNKINILKY